MNSPNRLDLGAVVGFTALMHVQVSTHVLCRGTGIADTRIYLKRMARQKCVGESGSGTGP